MVEKGDPNKRTYKVQNAMAGCFTNNVNNDLTL